MRTTFDFSPLFRSSVGFDQILNALEAASRVETIDNWPPYDIAKTGEDQYHVTLALAGFTEDELEVTQDQNVLMVSGKKEKEDDTAYLHRGIAARTFQRQFQLADHVKVVSASLNEGLLTINLQRDVPEELKPRKIQIAGSDSTPKLELRKEVQKANAA
jgi:molecular chaperone IbpA